MKQKYPDLYEQAKGYEKPNAVNGNIFYWNGDEPLTELERPERMAQIEENWAKTQARIAKQPKESDVGRDAGRA